jgi:hypothetical protein
MEFLPRRKQNKTRISNLLDIMKQILKQTLLQVIQKKLLYLNKEMTINSKFLANAIFGLFNLENCI